jgi:protein-tyrosine kinase
MSDQASTFEKAAKRLEELRRAGIDLRTTGNPPLGTPRAPEQRRPAPAASPVPTHATTAANRGQQVAAPPGSPAGAERNRTAPRAGKGVAIDLSRLAHAGFVTPATVRSNIADEFRVIKRPILDQFRGTSGAKANAMNLVMVTSALAGEGKTFTSINLAMSLAMEVDTSVLLIDADVARPSVLSMLGLPPAPGLMDLLTHPNLVPEDVLIRTNLPRLSILPAGAPQRFATELLASQAMGSLVQELSRRHPERVILFDAPPILTTTESRVLASRMGQIVFVVAARSTTHGEVRSAIEALKGCPNVMTVLNKSTRSRIGSYNDGGSDRNIE